MAPDFISGFNAFSQTLSEIQRIILQDTCTKDVFREMDGFLCLMSVLSTIQDRPTGIAVVESETQVLQDTIECTQWVFLILSEAMKNHHANTEYFRVSEMGSIFSNHTTKSYFTGSCWLRVIGPCIRRACLRTKDSIGNNGILTFFIAGRLLSFQFLLQSPRCTVRYYRHQSWQISSRDD